MKKTVFIAALCMLTLAAPARANVPEQKKPWLPALDKIYLKKSGYTVTEKPRPDRSYLLPDAVDYRVGQDYALPFTPHAGKPLIAIVIDDMGVDVRRSAEVLKLPAGLTVSYLPYAKNIREQTAAARQKGHELMLHLPMEPGRKTADPGPNYLGTGFTPGEIRRRAIRNLSGFEGYAAVNNHMGSQFTQHRAGLTVVMEELAKRDLMFLDSRTIASSIAEETAKNHGLNATHRDVFLDDTDSNQFVKKALQKVERTAKEYGSAIAIGHPKDITIAELKAWLPTLEQKGFQLAPFSAVQRLRTGAAPEKTALLQQHIANISPSAGGPEEGYGEVFMVFP